MNEKNMFRKSTFLILAMMVILSSLPVAAMGEPNVDQFNNRVKLTIGADTVTEELTDFPVMLKISETSGLSTFDVSRIFDEIGSDANRKKIAVTDADGNPLFVEIKEWTTASETAYLWAKVPYISATEDTVLYLYYDKDAPDNTLYVGDTGDPAAQQVWSNGYAGVWQMMPVVGAELPWTHTIPITYSATDVAIYQQDVVIHRSEGTSYEETVGGLKVWHVYVGNRCKSDYGDIRFTDASGTALDYYLWPDYDSSSAQFAVRVEGADTAGTLTVWYGNPAATTTSDGDATYDLWCDFLDAGEVAAVFDVVGTPSTTYADSVATITCDAREFYRSKKTFSRPARLEFRMADTAYGAGQYPGHAGFGDRSAGSGTYHISRSAYTSSIYSFGACNGSTEAWGGQHPSDLTLQDYQLDWISATSAILSKNGNFLESLSTKIPAGPLTVAVGRTWWYAQSGNPSQMRIDWILVRAYSATPPAATAFGPEQVIKQIRDSTANGNHGTIYGATEVDGPLGKALSYDGVSNKMEITEHTGITGANSNMLITTQFLTTNTNKTSQAIAGVWEGGSGELSWFLEITDANMIRFGISESGYPNYSIWQWNNSLNNNKWYTLSVFWEDNEHAILYIDGVEQDRINTPDLVSSINPSDYKYMVGVMNRYFSGSMSTTMINVDNPFITHSWVSTAHKSLTDNLFEYGPAGPEAEFTIEKSDVFIGYPVQFNDTSENDPTVWNWSFGDGKFSNEQHPFHIYEIPGNYTVLLNASNDDGFGSIYKSNCVRVRDVTFDVNRTIGVAPMPISFMDTTDGNVTGWTWVFDDGGVSTEQNPVHVYLNPGEYDATLIATTEDGPVATSKRIIIHDNYTTGHLPGYTDRFTLIINKTDTSFTDIPVKIVISENSGNNGYNISKIFDVLGDNRKKIAITREDGVTQQYVEIERWDSINREAVLWTKIPHINTEHDTVLYLNYGAEVVDNTEYVGDIGSKPANEVWSNGYYSVWHMVDESGVVRDSTKNNYDGIINGPISSGGGLSFNGISDHIVIGDTYLPSDLTIEADVIFTPDKNGNNIIVSKRSVYGRSVGRLTLSRTDNITDMNFDAWDFDTYPGLKSGLANIVLPSQEERYIIGGSRDASDTVGFSDGEVFAQITTNFTLPLDPYKNDTLSIGAVCYDAGTISEAFNGTINDIRISHVPRSESWMSVMYQSDMDMLFAYYATPVANFTANRTEINEGWDIQFNNTSLEEHDTWRWDFGDGTTSDLENPLKTYDMFGNYTVALTITGIGGTDSITKTDYIIVHNATPVADFALNRSEVNEFWPIQFNDMSTGTIHSLIWDFGDGSGSNDPNPVHMYPEFGTYTVNLTVSNDGGYSSHEKIITVHNTTPVSEFSANRTEVNEYWPIKFTNSATGTVHDYLWNFGNGVTSTEANPVYAYPDYGLYTVRLTVSNDGGSHYDEKTQYILVHNATPIINDFTASDIEVEYPVSIKFTPDITGVVHSVYWDFGDGQGSTDRSPSHTYTYAGTFTVELDVSNDGGQDAKIKTNYIKILSHYPTTGFATNYAGDRTVRFTDKSSVGEFDEPITEYYWDFGDGMISTEKNPVHFFQSLGQGSPYYNYFEVTHGSKNARGWTYVTKTVEVINEPNYIPVPPDRDTSVKWSPSTATYISMWWKSDNQNLDPGAFLESMTSAIQEHTKGLGIVMILFAVFLFLAVAYGDYAIALVMFVLAIPSITPDLLPIDFHIPMIVLVGILAAAVIYRTIKAVLEL